jgi:hypothetical protein
MKSLALAALAALALSTSAQASIIPVLTSVTPDGSNFTFSYSGQLAPDQGVVAGDQLVIIDFFGYVPGSVSSSLADVSASISDTLPAGLIMPPAVTDNPAIPDLVFTYNGPDFQATGGPYPALVDFTGLSAESTFGGTTKGFFSAVAVKNDGGEAGTATYNVGAIEVPSAAPESATWGLMFLGFFGLGIALRLRGGAPASAIA